MQTQSKCKLKPRKGRNNEIKAALKLNPQLNSLILLPRSLYERRAERQKQFKVRDKKKKQKYKDRSDGG